MNTEISITGIKYQATTNTALYPSGTQAAGINNQYYTLPNKPFIGQYDPILNLPLVDPTGQFFVTATFSESLEFSAPLQPTLTFTSITNTSFVLTVSSVGLDYATSYTYSFNSGASQALTLDSANRATFTAPAQSYNSLVVTAININGSTVSPIQYIQLLPSAPSLTASNISAVVTSPYNFTNTSNGSKNSFTISNIIATPPSLSSGYTISYTFTLTNILIWDTHISIGDYGGYLMFGNSVVNDSYNTLMIHADTFESNTQYMNEGTPSAKNNYSNFYYRRVRLERNNINNYTVRAYNGGDIIIYNGNGYILRERTTSYDDPNSNNNWWKFAETSKTYTSSTNSITFDGFSLISGLNPTVTVVTNYVLGPITLSSAPSAPLTITIVPMGVALPPPQPVLTLSSVIGSQNNKNVTITWSEIFSMTGYIISHTWTLTNALMWYTPPSLVAEGVIGTNGQIALYGPSQTLSMYYNRWFPILDIEIYDNYKSYPTGSFVLFTDNYAYIIYDGVGAPGVDGGYIPGSYDRWLHVANTAQRTGTVTTASKTFTGIIRSPVSSSVPTVTVISKYISTTDSTEVSSTPSAPLTITL